MTRIDPNRPQQKSSTGLKRVVLQASLKPEEAHIPKPVRSPATPKTRMLVITHSDRGVLDSHARQAIAAAVLLADAETAVLTMVLGELHEDIGNAGADEVMVLPTFNFQTFQPDVELSTALAVIESIQATRIFMPDNTIGDGDLGRRLIAHTQRTAATQVVEIDTRHVASYQSGNSVLARRDLPEIILLAANVADTELPFIAKSTRVDPPPIAQATGAYEDCGLQTSAATDIALEEADFIVSAGNGVQNLATLNNLANVLNAAVGASRVVVDDGKLPREKQIGATGKTVSASVYVAVGISGAVQHLQGIKDCRHVIAINRDSSAPIIKRADLSVIGDAEEIMQALIAEIATAKGAAA